MKERRKYCEVKPREERRHAVSKIISTVGMKIALKDRKRCSTGNEEVRNVG